MARVVKKPVSMNVAVATIELEDSLSTAAVRSLQ